MKHLIKPLLIAVLVYVALTLAILLEFRPWEDSIRPPVGGQSFTPSWALILFTPPVIFGAFLLLREALRETEEKLRREKDKSTTTTQ